MPAPEQIVFSAVLVLAWCNRGEIGEPLSDSSGSLLKRQGCVPRRLITDKLRSYLVLSKNEIVGLTAGHVSRC